MEVLTKNLTQTQIPFPPINWRTHFSELLGPKIGKTDQHLVLEDFIQSNVDSNNTIFEEPLKKSEILDAVKTLKNNKSTSFDFVSNEMLKNSMPVLLDPIFELFNTMINYSFYSSYWKLDILTPIHKKGVKDDANNYRGIAVASHFGKLFNTILKNRLQKFCDLTMIMKHEQISGKKGSRSADHLTIVRFLIEKYALKGGKRLYACCLT